MGSRDSFGARRRLSVGSQDLEIHAFDALPFDVERLPYSLKVLLENLVRTEDGVDVEPGDIEALAGWDPEAQPSREIAYSPGRILMQDFTGVPAVVDLAAMRDAMSDLGGDPARINPLIPVDLVIDHSIVADVTGLPDAFKRNAELEFQRNEERYRFLRWGQVGFDNFRVVPPNTGICHQVNLEYLSTVVAVREGVAFPDTLVGTDSHTPMVNGLGVLGWGVGGIEAEAAMLGQAISLLIPRVVGFRLTGELPEGSTATDLVLTVAEMLRKHGVVGKFVEFCGPGLAGLPVENRATIANMSPEYGSTVSIFPIDDETLRYLRFTGRSEEQLALVEAYAKEQGMWHTPETPEPAFSEMLELDLETVRPALAGPTRPQDLVPLDRSKSIYRQALANMAGIVRGDGDPDDVPLGVRENSPEFASAASFPASDPPANGVDPPSGGGADTRAAEPAPEAPRVAPPEETSVPVTLEDGTEVVLDHGAVVIAAITSCTNTSNPSVMMAAGLLAKNAVERGLEAKPWVKRSLAPGSKVVVDYYDRSGLTPYLEKLGFSLVGFGCTTCIGNSGPLLPGISEAVEQGDLVVCSVLSGNRNFEGRINPDCRMNFLASPPLCVTYALAGSMDIDLYAEPLGEDQEGNPVYLRDIWPSNADVAAAVRDAVASDMFNSTYAEIFEGDERWKSLDVAESGSFEWEPDSTYIRKPTFFDGLRAEPDPPSDVHDGRVLAFVGDSVTTDHISPAGVIKKDSPAGTWLLEQGVEQRNFNSYGSRRGNHEVMVRGTFANIRIRNKLVPEVEGGYTEHLPTGEQMTIYDASVRYQEEGTPLLVLAGQEYGSGSSRDWAAKGPRLQGVRAVIAESYERIHRSNLIGMGILPLQFKPGESAESLGLTGRETFDIEGIASAAAEVGGEVTVRADDREFAVDVRIDTPKETEFFAHGGILQYVLRQSQARG